MKVDEILENIIAAAKVIENKLPKVLLSDFITDQQVHTSALFLHNILILFL